MFTPELRYRVAQINVLSDVTFSSSVRFFRDPTDSEKRWTRLESQSHPVLIGHSDGLELNSDSSAKISAPDGGLIHVNGCLNSDLEVGGHHEIIISGDIAANATIFASGFFHIFVAGSMHGRIETSDSAELWIDGDFTGSIKTGMPSTKLHIAGDFSGEIAPVDSASLLWLSVGGYAGSELIHKTSQIGYTSFEAVIGRSNAPAGIYPNGPNRRTTEAGNSYSTWCIMANNGR